MNGRILAHLITKHGPRPRRLPRQLHPTSVSLRYFKALREGPIAYLKRITLARLVPLLPKLADAGKAARGVDTHRTDAAPDELGDVLDEIAAQYAETWSRENIGRLVQPFASDVAKFNASQLNKVLHAIAGVDVVGNEPWLADVIAAFTRENVALIKSLPSTTFESIEKKITGQMADGVRWEEMAAQLESELNVSESRANLIARDQVGKIYGDLNRVRQTDLGFERYIWRTMHDNRVRDEHEERDGQTFRWDDPPAGGPESGGHPGEAIQCRCYAEPDLDHLLEREGIDV